MLLLNWLFRRSPARNCACRSKNAITFFNNVFTRITGHTAAETALENAAFILARALANHFKKNGDLDNLGKVDLTKTDIVRLRKQVLLDKATAIRDLGNAAVSDPNAAGRGVTAARIATLTAAIAAFGKVMNTPRGQIVNKSALLREVETDVAALVQLATDMDDLALQFDGTDAGKRFIEA